MSKRKTHSWQGTIYNAKCQICSTTKEVVRVPDLVTGGFYKIPVTTYTQPNGQKSNSAPVCYDKQMELFN